MPPRFILDPLALRWVSPTSSKGTTLFAVSIVTRVGKVGAGVLVHGGAGAVDAARHDAHVEGCRLAAACGYAIIAGGGSALDAAQEAARYLEDAPQFNAGTGAALNMEGEVEHDAAIMCGETLRAGAVAALRSFKNPIEVARSILEHSTHVLLAGAGAARFAEERGHVRVDPTSLVTDAAREALERVRGGRETHGWAGGTIGAVARDRAGHVAAATSTGGTVAKLAGRVGDSPIIGAGTLADDESCSVSATGDGEGILKIGLARLIACALAAGVPLEDATSRALEVLARRTRATGGVIVIDRHGAWALARNTRTMSWALASDEETDAGI